MNCKPGELAVIVGSKSNGGILNGCMLRCVSVMAPEYWEVEPLSERLVSLFKTSGPMLIYDKKLRPIRDNDGQDETLSWKAVPKPDPVHSAVSTSNVASRASDDAPSFVIAAATTGLEALL